MCGLGARPSKYLGDGRPVDEDGDAVFWPSSTDEISSPELPRDDIVPAELGVGLSSESCETSSLSTISHGSSSFASRLAGGWCKGLRSRSLPFPLNSLRTIDVSLRFGTGGGSKGLVGDSTLVLADERVNVLDRAAARVPKRGDFGVVGTDGSGDPAAHKSRSWSLSGRRWRNLVGLKGSGSTLGSDTMGCGKCSGGSSPWSPFDSWGEPQWQQWS